MEQLILDPSELAPDRVEVDLTPFIRQQGIDYGDQAIEAYRAQLQQGETVVDYRLPNRIAVIPLRIKADDGMSFDEARSAIQAKAALWQREGGWIKRVLSNGMTVYGTVVADGLKLSGGWLQAHRNLDVESELQIEMLPGWFEDWEDLTITGGDTGKGEWIGLIEGHRGDMPADVRLVVTEESGHPQLGLVGHLSSRHYQDSPTARTVYEAEDLTPLDLATVVTLSGASGGQVVRHNDLSTTWTPVLRSTLPPATLPAVRAVGTVASGIGSVAPGVPAGTQQNDILVLFIETQNEAVTPPAGWAHVSGSPVSMATGTPTRLTVLWKRAGSSESAPTIGDPGDHIVARMIAVSGCVTTGDPWDATATGTDANPSINVAVIPGAITTVDGCLILAAVASGSDVASTSHVSGFRNALLTGLAKPIDNWVADGGGGGIAVVSGSQAAAGNYGATTATLGTPNGQATLSMALKPAASTTDLIHTSTRRLMARVHTTSETPIYVRALWDVGDITQPVENRAVRIPGADDFYLVDLGEVRLDAPPVGDHIWRFLLQARGGEFGSPLPNNNIAIDKVYVVDASECYSRLTAPPRSDPGLTAFTARDSFTQPGGGDLSNWSPEVGPGWESRVAGGDDFDIDQNGEGVIRRTGTGSAGARRTVTLGGLRLGTEVVSAEVRHMTFATNGTCVTGITHRFVDSQSSVQGYLSSGPSVNDPPRIWLIVQEAGTFLISQAVEIPLFPGQWIKLDLAVDAEGHVFLWAYPPSAAPREPLIAARRQALAAGGALEKGEAGVLDGIGAGASAVTREIRAFTIRPYTADAILHASRQLELRSAGTFRQTADGWGPTSPADTDLPLLPAAGLEGRPVELFLKGTRGDLDQTPDSGIDALGVTAQHRPTWLVVPGGS